MSTGIKVIVPKGLLFHPEAIMRAVENTLDATAAGAKVDFQATVETWARKPIFVIGKSRLKRTVFTIDEIYSYVSNGTRPHPIVPKSPDHDLVFFRTGFRAKTRVMALRSNKGHKANKNLTFSKLVQHPGTEARRFDEAVEKKWNSQMKVVMQRALDAEFIRQFLNNP